MNACSAHADRTAALACARCGSFACEVCSPSPSVLCRPCLCRAARTVAEGHAWWAIRPPGSDVALGRTLAGFSIVIVAWTFAIGRYAGVWPAAISCAVAVGVALTVRVRRVRADRRELHRAIEALDAGRHGAAAMTFELLARRPGTSTPARFDSLHLLASTMTHWGLHERAIRIARQLATSGFPDRWTAGVWVSIQTYAASLGLLDEARAARERALERSRYVSAHALGYADLVLAAREERWTDVETSTASIEQAGTALSPTLAAWTAVLRGFALDSRGADALEVEAALAPARDTPLPLATAIPAWPELRSFVERRVDSRRGT